MIFQICCMMLLSIQLFSAHAMQNLNLVIATSGILGTHERELVLRCELPTANIELLTVAIDEQIPFCASTDILINCLIAIKPSSVPIFTDPLLEKARNDIINFSNNKKTITIAKNNLNVRSILNNAIILASTRITPRLHDDVHDFLENIKKAAIKMSQNEEAQIFFSYLQPLTESYKKQLDQPDLKERLKKHQEVLLACPDNKNVINHLIKTINKEWLILLSPQKTFVVLLPRKQYKKRNLEKYGFSSTLQELSSLALLPQNYHYGKPINNADLQSIFSPTSPARKRIYLTGHGTSDLAEEPLTLSSLDTVTVTTTTTPTYTKKEPLIAELSYNQYAEFVKFLDKIGTDFLSVASCYAGGINLVAMQKELVTDLEGTRWQNFNVSFPIAIECISDTTSQTHDDINLKKFFSALDDFFATRNAKTAKEIQHWVKDPFKKILLHTAGTKTTNTPSIRFPGLNTYFNIVELDTAIETITYPALIAHELKNKTAKTNTPFVIDNKSMVLLYPTIIATPLVINTTVPALISMIPGNAFHVIESVNLGDNDLESFMHKSLFLRNLVASKGLFIKELRGMNHANSGLIDPNDPTKDTDTQKIVLKNVFLAYDASKDIDASFTIIAQMDKNKSYRMSKDGSSYEYLAPDTANKFIMSTIALLTPSKPALIEASGGKEYINNATKIIERALLHK